MSRGPDSDGTGAGGADAVKGGRKPGRLLWIVFGVAMFTIMSTLAIWPGEVKLTAPLFCPDDKPDTFVVSDVSREADGETFTRYTLYCLDENGAFHDAGFFFPSLVLFAAHTILILGLLKAVAAWRRVRAP